MDDDRATRFVQNQVAQLREDLDDFIRQAFQFQINHAYWHEMSRLDSDSKYEIRKAVSEAFEIASRRWAHTPKVFDAHETVEQCIKDSIEIALDVIYPEYTDIHLLHVHENIMTMFDRRWGPRLESAMLDYVESAVKIQDVWRKCYYEPTHPMCRRRLLRQFEELADDLETLRP
jgi:thymidylate synthase ThyX